MEAWSPLGRKDALDNEVLRGIGEKYGKGTAQVCIRWIMQHGILPLPKTVNPGRMAENADVFDFELTAEEMNHITAFCQLPESLQNGRQALADYIRVIQEEAAKRFGGAADPLLAAAEKHKDKKGEKRNV